MNKLSPADYREVCKVLAHLDSDFALRAEATPRMKEDVFANVRGGVDNIIRIFSPSPAKGNFGEMQHAINQWIKTCGITQDDYWLEVWIRGGRKPMGAYNGPKGVVS